MATELPEMVRLAKLGRRAEARGKAVRGCLTATLSLIVWNVIQAWTFMLGIAVLAAHWWPALPTIGYWWSLLAVSLLRGTLSLKPAHKAADK